MPLKTDFDEVYNAGIAAMRGEEPIYNNTNLLNAQYLHRPPRTFMESHDATLTSESLSCALGSGSDTSEDNGFQHGVSEAPIYYPTSYMGSQRVWRK